MEKLLEEVESSVKNPLKFRSFYVLFVTVFVLLLIPLTIIGLLLQRNFFTHASNSCAVSVQRTFTGTVDRTKDGAHVFVFSGVNCSLTAWVNGSGNVDLTLWVYEPDGNVLVVNDNRDKSYEFLYVSGPVKEGTYRLAVRLNSGINSTYTAAVSFR